MKLKEIERAVILSTLAQHDFNRSKTARVLGINRRTLQTKLRAYGAEAWGLKGRYKNLLKGIDG